MEISAALAQQKGVAASMKATILPVPAGLCPSAAPFSPLASLWWLLLLTFLLSDGFELQSIKTSLKIPSLDPCVFLLGAKGVCRGAGLCSARLCLCISCWPCGYLQQTTAGFTPCCCCRVFLMHILQPSSAHCLLVTTLHSLSGEVQLSFHPFLPAR